MSTITRLQGHYEHRIDRFGGTYKVLDWESRAAQYTRFAVLNDYVSLEEKSLLDVGCGLGDLKTYFEEHGYGPDYTGVDILSKMVDAAKYAHKDGRFVCADIFSITKDEREALLERKTFDVIFSSGIFNLDFGNNEAFLQKAVECFTSLADEYIVFNLLDKKSPDPEPGYAYYDPVEIKTQLAVYSDWEVCIVDDYLPNDFSVVMRRKR